MLWKLVLSSVSNLSPLPVIRSGVGSPKVTQCDGDYNHESRKNVLEWTLPVIDQSNSSGTMEFSIPGHEDDFFPVAVSFVSKKSFCGVTVSQWLSCCCHSIMYHVQEFI